MDEFIMDSSPFLTSHVMLFFWIALFSYMIFLCYKTGLWGFLVIAGGVSPWIIFHIYKLSGIWTEVEIGILYSRVAQLALVVSLFLAMHILFWRRTVGRQ